MNCCSLRMSTQYQYISDSAIIILTLCLEAQYIELVKSENCLMQTATHAVLCIFSTPTHNRARTISSRVCHRIGHILYAE